MIAYIAAIFTVGVILFVLHCGRPTVADDYKRCRGLDQVED